MGYYHDFLDILPDLKATVDESEKIILSNDKSLEVYNPFNYGIECYLKYLEKYFSKSWPSYIIIGLNPGIDGAVQTCIPFTDPYNCKKRLGIDPAIYLQEHKDINPKAYMEKPTEPSARIFYEALEEGDYLSDFLSKTLLLNAFPLGISQSALTKKTGGFFVKNVTPKNLQGELRKKIDKLSETYLKIVLKGLKRCNIVALGRYPSDRLESINIKHDYLIHPSPTALNTKGISKESWKSEFLEKFKSKVITLNSTVIRKNCEFIDNDYELYEDIMEAPVEIITYNLRWLSEKIFSIKTGEHFSSFALCDKAIQLDYVKNAKDILEKLKVLTDEDVKSLKEIGLA